MADNVRLPLMRREVAIVPGSLNAEQRSFDIMWSAGAEVPRMDWWSGQRYIEVLEVSNKAVRLDRLKSGRAPVLNSHSTFGLDNVMGVIDGKSVRIEGGEAHATVRLSQRQDIAGLVGDIRDGIIANVSPGYITHSYREEMRDGQMYRIATDWEPLEISFVPVGADPDAGLRGMSMAQTYPCLVERASDEAAAARIRMRQRMLG